MMVRETRPTWILMSVGAVMVGIIFANRVHAVAPPTYATTASDLDVTYIERVPRYPRNLSCTAGVPCIDYPCPSPLKHAPDSGEVVTFTARVRNKGTSSVSQFGYTWDVDDALVQQGTHVWSDAAEQLESYQWHWQPGPHRIRFTVTSPGDSVTANNTREERTNAYALSIFVEQGQYDAFESRTNLIGSRSFEDWIQAQFDEINRTFVAARYPTTPDGILTRVQIDKIVVAPEMDGLTANAFRLDPDEFFNDGRWLFSDGYSTNARGNDGLYQYYADLFVDTYDWGLIHELGHQIGRFDMYNIDFNPEHNLITGPDGAPLRIGHWAAYGADIMESPGSGVWSEYHAASFNRDYGDRAGLFGAYVFDLPTGNRLRFVDSGGQPVSGARISVYHDQNDSLTDASLTLSGTIDTGGYFPLGANPFGALDRGAVNATLFISITVSDRTEYHWVEATALNLAFWRGHQTGATYTITLGMQDNRDLTLPPVLPADITPPSVSLMTPTTGTLLSGLGTFAATAEDDRRLKRVEIILDGRPICVFPQPPYSVTWDTAQVQNGPHQVWARAYDTALPSHSVDSPAVTITTQNATAHVFSWDYNLDNDFDAWQIGWRKLAEPTVEAGSLRLAVPTGDPGMWRWLPFGFSPQANQLINVRMRVSGGGTGYGQFYWTTYADQQEDESKVVYFTVYGDNAWHEYSIPVGRSPLWSHRIRTIRFDPVDGEQYVGYTAEIDWLRLLDSAPTPTNTPTNTLTDVPTNTPTHTPTQTPISTPTSTAVTSTIHGNVRLQGRPAPPHVRWSVPLTVTVCGTPHPVAADPSGRFTVTGLLPGLCDIQVKNGHTLSNIRHAYPLANGVNVIDMGELKEGDANNDDRIDSSDFVLMRVSYLKSAGQPGFVDGADFNEDNTVNSSDFLLLRSNYFQGGPIDWRELLD